MTPKQIRNPSMSILIHPIVDDLPKDISVLQSDAAEEGYRFVDRLIDEWDTHVERFTKPREALLAAKYRGAIAGIGGITIEPSDKTALRMRRFYVRPIYRRTGIARALAATLIEDPTRTCCDIYVNAGTQKAFSFWEEVGFVPIHHSEYTHVWSR